QLLVRALGQSPEAAGGQRAGAQKAGTQKAGSQKAMAPATAETGRGPRRAAGGVGRLDGGGPAAARGPARGPRGGGGGGGGNLGESAGARGMGAWANCAGRRGPGL